jgi:hypothetical protein
MHTSLSLHFIDVQSLDMFRALLRRHYTDTIGGYCVLKLIMSIQYVLLDYIGLGVSESENAVGQIMPKTCRDIEHQ